MKKSKAVNTAGIIDNENCLSDDFDLLSLDESRAVLSVRLRSMPLGLTFPNCFEDMWLHYLISTSS